MAFWATSFACASRLEMLAFLLVNTAWTTGSSAWYTLCVEAAGSGYSFCLKMPFRNGPICLLGTLMYGLIQEFATSYCFLLKIGNAGTPTGCLFATRIRVSRSAAVFLTSFSM